MNKSILLLTLLFACSIAANIRLHKEDEWTKIDVNNLNDRERSIDDFIRKGIKSLNGELKGAAHSGNLFRYAYLSDKNENWDVQVLNDGKKSEIEVATRTQTYPDENNPNVLYNKKTSIIKKAFADILQSTV